MKRGYEGRKKKISSWIGSSRLCKKDVKTTKKKFFLEKEGETS